MGKPVIVGIRNLNGPGQGDGRVAVTSNSKTAVVKVAELAVGEEYHATVFPGVVFTLETIEEEDNGNG